MTCQPCHDKELPLKANISGFSDIDASIIKSSLNEWNLALNKTVLVTSGSDLDAFQIDAKYNREDTTAGTTHGGTCDVVINMASIENVVPHLTTQDWDYYDALSVRNDALKMVVMHELGHSLGTTRHLSDKDSLMAKERVLFTPMACIDAASVEFVCETVDCPDTATSTCGD